VDVKVAGDDEFMRRGSGKERKELNSSRKTERRTINIEYRYF